MRGWRMTWTWWESSYSPRTRPYGAPLDTRPIGPNKVAQHLDMTSGQQFDNFDRHKEDTDMSLDPYESLLHPRSREYLNAPIRLRMR
jgi:hypothetical protein